MGRINKKYRKWMSCTPLYNVAKALSGGVQYLRLSPLEKAYFWYMHDGGEEIRFDYAIRDEDVVMDLGGYMGDWTAALPNPDCRVYLFEPMKEFAEECEKRFAGRDNIRCFAVGLDASTHEAEISREEDGSSQYHSKGENEKAQFVDIEEFMDQHGIQEVKLIKMNIEGGEYDILEKLIADGRIRQFDHIQIQFHDIPEIHARERMKKIWAGLKKTHRLEWAYRPFIHESWARK
ncbi:MAG: FkbM family methyltransferase [Lachnospiraceae bacterium]|nr:FkbM family methyltransferase [Lachnospiraceae bacterium]